MKKITCCILLMCCVCHLAFAIKTPHNPQWITASEEKVDEVNTWIAYRKDITLSKTPKASLIQIAADSKYWLWINGELVIFEGGLKRGPTPNDTYYDEIDIARFLKKGNNQIAVLLWYFGKEGFSHHSSGRSGLIINSDIAELNTTQQWWCRIHPAYKNTNAPFPNYRLPESNILFDANLDIPDWQTADYKSKYTFKPAEELGTWGVAPWNKLIKRPIPFWKDFGIKEAEITRKAGTDKDSIIARLPYNMQVTPVIHLTDERGDQLVSINTDHSFAGSTHNIRAEYLTKKGAQSYESLGWMNGQQIILVVPKGITIHAVKYRETGYDTHVEGRFSCDNDFYMRFWEKGLRTLYVNMRDTYFDCPDRERAQWWGDVVVLMGESFYTYSTSAHALMKKAIYELCNWRKEGGILYSPVPAGSWKNELPAQMLASIGRYGFWNYYMNTADVQTIKDAYPAVKSYLNVWSLDETGLTAARNGDWDWGDWGNHIDLRLSYAGWHYLALEGAACMAELLGYPEDASAYKQMMEQIKTGYNACWTGYAYRHPSYQGETDDRVQALAVISCIADESKYERISQLFKTQWHASPYMEKYVMEALFIMGQGEYAMERTEKRFAPMVNHPDYSTLFEGWGIGSEGYGGGTVNHAWSGGSITVISQYLCGIYPLEAGYQTFCIDPNPVLFREAAITVPTVAGNIESAFTDTSEQFTLKITVPSGTKAVVYLPTEVKDNIRVNGKRISDKQFYKISDIQQAGKTPCLFTAGTYEIVANR